MTMVVLEYAVFYNKVEYCKRLVPHVDLNATGITTESMNLFERIVGDSFKPLETVIYTGNLDLLRLFTSNCAVLDFTSPMVQHCVGSATAAGKTQIVTHLLDLGLDVNYMGGELLVCAVLGKRYEMVKLLVDRGADKTANQSEALILARKKKLSTIISLLE